MMMKISKKNILIGAGLIVLVVYFGFSFLARLSAKEWTPPKFVKEWEIKEIKPGLTTEVISLTANKNGVFALVKAEETVYLPVKSSGDAKKLFESGRGGCMFSGGAVSKMSQQERNELIDMYILLSKHGYKPSALERDKFFDLVSEYRKKYEYEDNNKIHEKELQKLGKKKYIDEQIKSLSRCMQKELAETLAHHRIQHYDFDGNFISQWPEGNKLTLSPGLKKDTARIEVPLFDKVAGGSYKVDSRERLMNPLIMDSDDSGNIYVADYEGNKVVKFDSEGKMITAWKITSDQYASSDSLNKGMAVGGKRVYIMYAFDGLKGTVPVLVIFDTNGKFLGKKTFDRPSVPVINPYVLGGIRIPLRRENGHVNSIAVDVDGNMYQLAGYFNYNLKVYKYDKDFNEEKSFEPVLKDGFDLDIEAYNPETNKAEPYREHVFKGMRMWRFNSQKVGDPSLWNFYALDKVYLSPDGDLFVTFKGRKPFGAINSIIYNTTGKMLGYWKVDKKSNVDWFIGLTDVEKIKADEKAFSMGFYGNNIFVAKTIEYRKGDKLDSEHGQSVSHSVIQRFDREERRP